MRPRYEARVATMRHRQQGHRPWVLVRVTHGTDDGVPVEFTRVVASYGDRDDAIAEAEHRNDMQEGLRRIGVAVAVWAGMQAMLSVATEMRVLLDNAEATLDAERAARRKWELRLRWRAQNSYEQRRKWRLRLRWRAQNSYEQRHPDLDDIDRLYRHEVCAQRDPQKNTERLGNGITRFRWYFDAARRLPIAGPRGVLP